MNNAQLEHTLMRSADVQIATTRPTSESADHSSRALTKSHPPPISSPSSVAHDPAARPPPAYMSDPRSLQEKINQVADELDLSDEIVHDLLGWYGTQVVVIADDSGSMTAIADYTNATTRWEELQRRLSQLLQLLLVLDPDAEVQLGFLNSKPPHSSTSIVLLKSQEDLEQCWQWAKPKGRTPLWTQLSPWLRMREQERDRLILVLTDGEPSDCKMSQLERSVAQKTQSGNSHAN